MQLEISNVINVQVQEPGVGLGEYNTSNVALFTDEAHEDTFGDKGFKIYLSPTEVEVDFGSDSKTYKMAVSLFSQQPNILANRGYLVVIPLEGGIYSDETLGEAITRTKDLVQYFGILSTFLCGELEGKAAASVVSTLDKILFLGSRTEADLEANGYFDDIRLAKQNKARCLYYGGGEEIDTLKFLAGYAGRGLSVNFNGSNTTLTMHLKDIRGLLPDETMTQTLLNKAKLCGADTYVSLQGVPKVFCSGANDFFDNVYNLLWFVGRIKVDGFNTLATTGTKIPQTEDGMDLLKGSYRRVCEQGVVNRFLAPGEWNSPDTFGNQADFLDNIRQRGYYIYSQPLAQQSPAAREAREAPLVQIAIKLAGAIHSSTVIININR